MIQQRIAERGQWTAALLNLPEPHVLQTWEWGEVKRQTGWQPTRLLWQAETNGAPVAAASLLLRRIPRLPRGVAYVPKGPILDWSDERLVDAVLAAIELEARRQGAIFVKIDPDVAPDSQIGRSVKFVLQQRGWQPSLEQIQFRNTALLDLTPDEEGLLAAMKPKWRYNIRLAGRRGMTIRRGDVADLPAFYDLYRETGGRDGFIVRPFDYYAETWRTFMQPMDADAPCADLLLAEVEGAAVAGLILFRFADRAWYMYGASSERQRAAMPNHLLQWEAMRLARAAGCTVYDLWGAPDTLDESDGMWGVWRFKEGFGARFAPHIGAWDYPVSSTQYRLYTDAMAWNSYCRDCGYRVFSYTEQIRRRVTFHAGGKMLQSGGDHGCTSTSRRLPFTVYHPHHGASHVSISLWTCRWCSRRLRVGQAQRKHGRPESPARGAR
ncbi:MAG: peptidoglycan bridge formation glycyltransferase FemA/FemB family protein [Caldilineales bacterium]